MFNKCVKVKVTEDLQIIYIKTVRTFFKKDFYKVYKPVNCVYYPVNTPAHRVLQLLKAKHKARRDIY